MLAGIKEILFITKPQEQQSFKKLLVDSSATLSYLVKDN